MRLRMIAFVSLMIINIQICYANVTNKLPCPTVNTIQLHAYQIDQAVQFNQSYIASTSKPVFRESRKNWVLSVVVKAKSRMEAIEISKRAVSSIKHCTQKYAIDHGNGEPECLYAPMNVGQVYGVAIRNNN